MIRLSKQPRGDPINRSKMKNEVLRHHSFSLFDGNNTSTSDATKEGEEKDDHGISQFDTTPPTEEIVFAASWDNEELDNTFHSEEDGAVSIHSLLFHNKSTNDDTVPPILRCNSDTTRGIPSLLLLAACTYSRVFGLEYLPEESHGHSDRHSDDASSTTSSMFFDWYRPGPPLRSMILLGDTNTSETKSSNSGDREVHHSESIATIYGERCLWIIISLGLVLVLGFASVLFYLAIDTIQASRRYWASTMKLLSTHVNELNWKTRNIITFYIILERTKIGTPRLVPAHVLGRRIKIDCHYT